MEQNGGYYKFHVCENAEQQNLIPPFYYILTDIKCRRCWVDSARTSGPRRKKKCNGNWFTLPHVGIASRREYGICRLLTVLSSSHERRGSVRHAYTIYIRVVPKLRLKITKNGVYRRLLQKYIARKKARSLYPVKRGHLGATLTLTRIFLTLTTLSDSTTSFWGLSVYFRKPWWSAGINAEKSPKTLRTFMCSVWPRGTMGHHRNKTFWVYVNSPTPRQHHHTCSRGTVRPVPWLPSLRSTNSLNSRLLSSV